jgi:hypothetical protein
MGITHMRRRPVRTTVRYQGKTGGLIELPAKDSQFTMSDDPVVITLEPGIGRVMLAVGSQTVAEPLTDFDLSFVLALPIGTGKSRIGKAELDLVPNAAKFMGLLTDSGHGKMQVHVVESEFSFHGLVLVVLPVQLKDLDQLTIEIVPLP